MSSSTNINQPLHPPCRPSFPLHTRRYHYHCYHCHTPATLSTLYLSPRGDLMTLRCWNCRKCPINPVVERVARPTLIEYRRWTCWACELVQDFEYIPDTKGECRKDIVELCNGCGRERDAACTVGWDTLM